jgi:PAS domain S-box-containing protein
MKVLYLNGVDRSRDSATTAQLAKAEPSLELTTVSSSPDAFARIREAGDFDALVTSPAVARSETLALIVSLRRDRVPVVIVPVVTETQQDFATAAMAAGADDVLLQLGGTLLNPTETLTRVLVGRRKPKSHHRLRVLYAGLDELVWTLLEQLPFVKAVRATLEPGSGDPVRNPESSGRDLDCDVVVIDTLDGPAQTNQAIASMRQHASDTPLLALTPPTLTEDEVAAMALRPGEHVAKTGLYRRPLAAALERLLVEREAGAGGPVAAAATPTAPVVANGHLASEPVVLSEPAEPAPAPAAPTEDASAAIERARAAWDAERAELTARLAASEDAAARVSEVETAREAARAAVERLEGQVRSLEEARQVERARWQESTGSLESRLRSAAAAAAREEFEITVAAGKAELERAEQQHAGQRAAWDRERAELAERLRTVEGVSETFKIVSRQLDEARLERDATVAQRDATRQDLDQMRDGVARAESERDEAQRECDELRANGDGARGDLAQVLAERDSARADVDAARADADAARADVDAAREQFENTVAAGKAELERAEQRHADQRAAWNRERAELAERLRTLDGVSEASEGVARQLDEAHRERDELRVDLDGARSELDRMLAERDSVRSEVDAARADADAARGKFEVTVAAGKAELERAEQQHADQRAAWDRDRAAHDEARRELDEARAHRESARTELEEVRADHDAVLADLERVSRELVDAREALRRAGEEHTAQTAAWHALETSGEDLRTALDTTRAELDAEREASEAARAALEQVRRELQDALDAARGELDAAAEHHRRFVRRGLFAHCRMTRSGRLIDCNDTFARLFGYANAADVLGQHADRPFAPLSGRDALDARLLADDGHAHRVESCLTRADGEAVRVFESAALVSDAAPGELVERVLIDLSECQMLEDQLHRAKRAGRVGALAAEISADVDASLHAAADAARRAAEAAGPTHPLHADLDAVRRETERATGLIRQLLAFSRRQQRPADPLDLRDAVGRADLILRQLLGPDVTLELRGGEAVTVPVSLEDATQLLTTLAVQARDLLPLGGAVRVETALASSADETGIQGRRARLSVVASGYGVEAPELSDALNAMADRCGGSLSRHHEPGRESRFDVSFTRCARSNSGGLS